MTNGPPGGHLSEATRYRKRLFDEQDAYRDCVEVHDLPGIFHYWSNRHVRPMLEAFGFSTPIEMFRKYLAGPCGVRRNEAKRFVSIGSGNCGLEIDLGLHLLAAGRPDFVIDCLDLNPAMLERGRIAAARHGVSAHLNFVQADFNEWNPSHEYDAAIANQSLHHVVKLEDLFARIKSALKPHGTFIVSDMIGRNGHQRWPEALDIVRHFWRQLPPSYRFNRRLQCYEEVFEDRDYSIEGFEGIRSQDILPQLVEHFHFQLFIGFANAIDPFVDRAFGDNFDPGQEWDRRFIDQVHQRDQEAIVSGRIAPTHMLAVMGNDPGIAMIHHAPLTPEFCLRNGSGSPAAIQVAHGAYEWETWPHSAQSELEIACARLKMASDRMQEQAARTVQLMDELERRTAWALQLEQQLDERTAWALQLDSEVGERTSWALRLTHEIDERTAWAVQLDRDIEELTDRTLQLNQEMEANQAKELQLSKELERLSWARALDRRFHRPLHGGFELVRWVRYRIKQMLTSSARIPTAR